MCKLTLLCALLEVVTNVLEKCKIIHVPGSEIRHHIHIYIYIYMYVCMYVCMCVCSCVCVCVCVCARARACAQAPRIAL